MADKISNHGRAGLDISRARSRETSRTESRGEAGAGRKAESGSDAVDLSSTATMLKQAELRLRAQPEVDQSRVEQLRQRIAAGEYEVSAEKLAAKLIRLEQGLG